MNTTKVHLDFVFIRFVNEKSGYYRRGYGGNPLHVVQCVSRFLLTKFFRSSSSLVQFDGGRWHDLKSVIVPCHSLPALRLAVGVVVGGRGGNVGLGAALCCWWLEGERLLLTFVSWVGTRA
jgi:hypothetical protein